MIFSLPNANGAHSSTRVVTIPKCTAISFRKFSHVDAENTCSREVEEIRHSPPEADLHLARACFYRVSLSGRVSKLEEIVEHVPSYHVEDVLCALHPRNIEGGIPKKEVVNSNNS